MIDYDGPIQDINPRFIEKANLVCAYCLKEFKSYHNDHNNFSGFGYFFSDQVKIHYCPYCDKYCLTDKYCAMILKVEKRASIFMKIKNRLFK
jgi:hypothetical protein